MLNDELLAKRTWERAIILMDLNAFFASIEQLDFPHLRGLPVAVTNGSQGSCIITCSYEARRFGIKTGMRFYEAVQQCPGLIRRPARPGRYSEISREIMGSLIAVTPDIEIFSVDEAFLDVTACQQLFGSPEKMGRMVKEIVYKTSGLLSSVGVSGDKTTAKYAAKLVKPDGLTIIPPWESEQRLANVPVTELCGIASGIGRFLGRYGVLLCGQMKNIPASVLIQRFGPLGHRIWLMAQGKDPSPVLQSEAAPKSVGHGKVLPPRTVDKKILRTYFFHMSEKVATRLRRHDLEAQKYFIGIRITDGYISDKLKLEIPNNDGRAIFNLCDWVLEHLWDGEEVWQVQVTALDPRPAGQQLDFFAQTSEKQKHINNTMDSINQRFGSYALTPAMLLNRSTAPNVIAPAWRPDGVRDSV
jgi:DNA polymerase-4